MSDIGSESENPVIAAPTVKPNRPRTNQDWWPNQLDLSVLHHHSPQADPMGEDFNYAEEFATLDLEAVKADLGATGADLELVIAGYLLGFSAFVITIDEISQEAQNKIYIDATFMDFVYYDRAVLP